MLYCERSVRYDAAVLCLIDFIGVDIIAQKFILQIFFLWKSVYEIIKLSEQVDITLDR